MPSDIEKMREMGLLPTTEEEWDEFIKDDDWVAPGEIGGEWVIPDVPDEEDQYHIEEARGKILAGMTQEVDGRLLIVKALLELQENELWRKDPIVIHLERPGWTDYIRELSAWIKDHNPQLQVSQSTLFNYTRYHKLFVQGMGLPEEKVFGATEKARRDLCKMVRCGHGGGLPKALSSGFDVEKLPQPPSFTGEEDLDRRVQAGFRQVCEDVFSEPFYSTASLDDYRCGDGHDKYTISMSINLDLKGLVVGVDTWIKKTSGNGDVLESYKVNLLTEEMPVPVLDWLESKGIKVISPE